MKLKYMLNVKHIVVFLNCPVKRSICFFALITHLFTSICLFGQEGIVYYPLLIIGMS